MPAREALTYAAGLPTKTNAEGRCVCMALSGQVGSKVACDIYEQRPDVCRNFPIGSAQCISARQMHGVA